MNETSAALQESTGTAGPNGRGVAALAEIAFPVPVHRTFDYLVPSELAATLRAGHRVLAPFGQRGLQVGVVMRVHDNAPAVPRESLKPVYKILEPEPALGPETIRLSEWMADRYFCSIGQAVFSVLCIGKRLPPKRDQKPVEPAATGSPSEFTLTNDQRAAVERILPSLAAPAFKPFLLLGVAASGKTEVYLRAIEEALRRGRSALYLVPEIGLTPQVEAILLKRFGPVVEVWHSEISHGERWRIWRAVLTGRCRVLLGPRSAVFAPLRDLGLIVMDEEHDPSYKEDSIPRYHTREVALQRARLHGAAIVLGSATPSMESYVRARDGEFELLEMPGRVLDRPAPAMTLVDQRRYGWQLLAPPLAEAVTARLDRREQAILFLNRRGFATYVTCRDCGWEARCPECAVSLVYHKGAATVDNDMPLLSGGSSKAEGLHCHYCSHHIPLPDRCPDCRRETVKLQGRGTQRTTADLKLWFPKARLLRWDRDSTRKRGAHGEAFDAVHSDAVDIVVGTQMIAQGLDFPRVTLVGVLDADRTLRFPDFRAGERTFQLLTQVSGRAGRAETPGEVFLQTRNPDHYAIQAALKLDYKLFAEQELAFRREMSYPPYVRLIQLLLRGKNAARVESAAEELMTWLEGLKPPPELQLLGPAPSFHLLRAGFTQWQVMVKGPADVVTSVLGPLRDYKPPKSIALIVDADPEELQ